MEAVIEMPLMRRMFLVLSVLILIPASLLQPSRAWAQTHDVTIPPSEISGGQAVGALSQDVNLLPDCVVLSLPCRHASKQRYAGAGGAMTIVHAINKTWAMTVNLSRYSDHWDSERRMRDTDHVSTLLAVSGGAWV